MMRALLAVPLLAGCPSEGGIAFSYGMYKDGPTPTLVTSCSDVDVLRVRFEVGSDTNSNNILDEDELEGRAVDDCNQQGSQLGQYETELDRLPAGEYDLFAISFVPFVDGTIASRTYPGTSYADRWSFSNPGAPAVVIEEGTLTTVAFTAYEGGTSELRMVLR